MNLLSKATQVVDSCETLSHMENARTYLNLVLNKLEEEKDIDALYALDDRLTTLIVKESGTRGMLALETGVIKVAISCNVIESAPEFFTLLSKLPVEIHVIGLEKDIPHELEYDYSTNDENVDEYCERNNINIMMDDVDGIHLGKGKDTLFFQLLNKE